MIWEKNNFLFNYFYYTSIIRKIRGNPNCELQCLNAQNENNLSLGLGLGFKKNGFEKQKQMCQGITYKYVIIIINIGTYDIFC